MSKQYDVEMQRLYRQTRILNQGEDGRTVGESTGRIQKWGDINPVNPPGNISVPGGIEQPYVDIGPFPSPIPVRLDAHLQPAGADILFGAKALQFTYRLVWSVGNAAVSREFKMLPRQMNVRSLQVYAKHNQGVLEPAQSLAIWATPMQAANPNPVPIDYEEVSMAIGVGTVDLMPPPRLATHVTVWAAPSTNLQLFLQFYFQGIGTPFYMLPLFSQVSNNPSYYPPIALPHDARLEYKLRRSATTAVENFAIAWCR